MIYTSKGTRSRICLSPCRSASGQSAVQAINYSDISLFEFNDTVTEGERRENACARWHLARSKAYFIFFIKADDGIMASL